MKALCLWFCSKSAFGRAGIFELNSLQRVLLVVLISASQSSGADQPAFNTVRVEGRNFINLADFKNHYGFDRNSQQNGLDLTLKSKYRSLKLRINSRECFLDGVRIWLDHPPLEYRNSALLSEIDIRKTLHPLLKAWSLRRRKVRTIMLDPGHGGEDQGTVGGRRISEKRLALDLAFRVEKTLQRAGFRILMTRRHDHFISLEDRSELANSSDADLFVSLHFNSAMPNRVAKGVETYCIPPVGTSSTGSIRRRLGIGDFGEEPSNEFDSYNILLAYLVQQQILNLVPGTEDRGVKRARFFVIRATECPSILIESGFLSNPSEEKRILDSKYRDKLATAISDGIERYTKLMNGNK